VRIFDSDDVHDMDEGFHSEQCDEKPDGVSHCCLRLDNFRTRQLDRTSVAGLKAGDNWAHLPHEIVEGEYRSCDVEWRIERVCEIIQEGVCGARMENRRALLVA
jgi:hypothetical protein